MNMNDAPQIAASTTSITACRRLMLL